MISGAAKNKNCTTVFGGQKEKFKDIRRKGITAN